MSQKFTFFTLVIITFIFNILGFYRLFFIKYDYNILYEKYIPNYKDKYDEILKNYELISDNYNFIPAQVIHASNQAISNIFYINKGLKDNVLENSYVVNENGLVGVIKKVFDNYSVVQLVSSENINIAVEINDCYGTLKNNYISDLINCENVKVSDPVFTSKYSISSSNILIGHIKKIKDNRIYVDYILNPYQLGFVGIIYDDY